MKRVWRAVAFGLAAYVFFLILSAPADRLLPYLQPRLQDVQLAGLGGSIWSGSAARAAVGPVQLDAVRWSWRPLALFKLALEFDIDAEFAGQTLSARAGRGLFAGPYLGDVEGRLPMSEITRLAGVDQISLGGFVDYRLSSVEWNDTAIPAVAGELDWKPAGVVQPLVLDLGAVRAQSEIDAGATEASLSASGGALTLGDGRFSLQPDGQYEFAAMVRKAGPVPAEVDQFLSTFAEFRDGGYLLEWSDQIAY